MAGSRPRAGFRLLVVVAPAYPTTEGDPIREYYRLTPEGALEVFTDSTDDSTGPVCACCLSAGPRPT